MATEQAAQTARPWLVEIWVPDETELNKVPGNFDHFMAMADAQRDLEQHARRQGLSWLVRADTELGYQRADGTRGSFYPDLLVALDISVAPTEPYEIPMAGKAPEVVVEVLSPSTAGEDRGDKMTAYAQMGVREYLVFDPRPRARPLLAGYRLRAWGQYEPLPATWGGGVWLESLRLRATAEPADDEAGHGPRLRFHTEAGELLPHNDEEVRGRLQAEHRLATQQAVLERAEQERQQAEEARRKAERERQQAEEARRKAEQELQSVQVELARLRALLPQPHDETYG